MQMFKLAILAALTLALGSKLATRADDLVDCENNQEAAMSLNAPLGPRLNQLVLDDNLRVLRRSVSDFTRNTPSFKKVEAMVGALSNRNLPAKDRWEAAQALGDFKRVVAVLGLPALVQSFNGDPDITVRNYAALALVKLDLRVAVPQLVQGLESSDPDIRQLSASTLHTAGAAAVPMLTRLVKCSDPHMKQLGCLALAEVGAPASSSLTALKEVVTECDTSGTYSVTAAQSIARIKNRLAENALTDLPFDAQQWKGSEQDIYRPAMVKDVISGQMLLGKNAEQLRNLLGPGISYSGGQQFRYCVGAMKQLPGEQMKKQRVHPAELNVKSSAVAAERRGDAYLVVFLKDRLVHRCELKRFTQVEWNTERPDSFAATPAAEPVTISSRL